MKSGSLPGRNFCTAAKVSEMFRRGNTTAFSHSLTCEHLEDYAEITSIELLLINAETTIENFKRGIRINEAFYR